METWFLPVHGEGLGTQWGKEGDGREIHKGEDAWVA